MKHTLTFQNADDLLTAATLRDMLNGRGGVPLTDRARKEYAEQLAEVEADIPADLARAAWTDAAARDAEAVLSATVLAWLREQNVVD